MPPTLCTLFATLSRRRCESRAALHAGVVLVQDLSTFDMRLAARLLTADALSAQVQLARMIFFGYTVRWRLILVDAPRAFAALWAILKNALPESISSCISFVHRPSAPAELNAMLGRPVL